MTPAALAAGIRRLRPCHRSPERFHEERDALARAVAALPYAAPCSGCPAARQRLLLAAARCGIHAGGAPGVAADGSAAPAAPMPRPEGRKALAARPGALGWRGKAPPC
jgi:hypothetical protein